MRSALVLNATYEPLSVVSARRAVCLVLADKAEIVASADRVVLPGVGAFAWCMQGIRRVGADQVVGTRLAGGRPVLGICVGMQVMFEHGVEQAPHARLGVRQRLEATDGAIPHTRGQSGLPEEKDDLGKISRGSFAG